MNYQIEFHDIIVSAFRHVAGLTFGSLFAIVTALLVGISSLWVNASTSFVFNFLRSIPILVMAPLFAKIIGIGEISKILLVTWACFFPIYISMTKAVSSRLYELEHRMATRKIGKTNQFRYYIVPRMSAGFVSGVEISIGVGWLTIVAAETMGTYRQGLFRGGIGDKTYNAIENGHLGFGLEGIFCFGFLGVSSSWIWRTMGSKLVAWLIMKL